MSEPCPFCERILMGLFLPMVPPAIVRFAPLNPVTEGHLLFVPMRHVESAAVSPVLAGMAMHAAAGYGNLLYESFNLITSAGEAATQTVMHLHVHLIPRREGDGLALPWTGQR